MSRVLFSEQSKCTWFRDRTIVKHAVRELFRKEGTRLEQLAVIFCTDDFLLDMNQKFLKHNYYTDIITFDLSTGPGVIGELYISIDRVVENAETMGLDKAEEIRRVIFHGCLHLCGYKDKLNADKAVMRAKEEQYLRWYRKRST